MPIIGVPSPDGIVGSAPYNFNFNRLGVRVPAILISRWIERGTGPYPSSEFEHSSTAATTKKIFNLKNFLTKRDEWAGTFENVFLSRTTPTIDCPVTLPEPIKLREGDAKEEAKLSEFQAELVQMAATLNGDHTKDIYPYKLVENLTVSEAVKYCDAAFKAFLDECKKAKERGLAESQIVVCGASSVPAPKQQKSPKSFPQKIFSCLICDH